MGFNLTNVIKTFGATLKKKECCVKIPSKNCIPNCRVTDMLSSEQRLIEMTCHLAIMTPITVEDSEVILKFFVELLQCGFKASQIIKGLGKLLEEQKNG